MNEVSKIESADGLGTYEFESAINISTTPGAGQFDWQATQQGADLVVTVSYGGGDKTDNSQTVTIPVGETGIYPLSKATNTTIYVEGKIRAVFWETASGGSRYVLSLTNGTYQYNGKFTAHINNTIVAAFVG